MSRLEELIKELCPDGVEYSKIGTYVDYKQPTKYIVKSTDYNNDFPTPVLTAGQTFILGYTNEKEGIYNASKESPVIIFDDFTGAFKWVDFNFKVKSSAMKILTAKNNMLIRYLFHCMGYLNFTSNEHKRLWIGTYSDFEIPVPPLEIQREIVRILDNFTSLKAELQAELQARKKQYEYYRNRLLTFGNDIKVVSLSEIADIGTGNSNTNEGLTQGKYPFYVRSPEPLWKNEYEYDETAIITAGDGVGVGKVFHYVEGKYALHQRAYRIHIKSNDVLPRYYYHYMRTAFLPYIKSTMFQGSVASIRRPMLNKFPVPIPSLDVQQRLVNVLDNFEKICSDLNIGLPAEIEARQKQYEYYRDALLSFDNSYFVNVERERERERDEWHSGLIKLWQYVFGYAPVKLKDIAISIKDGMHNLPKSLFDNGDYPILSAQNIHNGFIDFSTKRYVDINTFLKERRRTNIESGDVLLTIVATIGRTAIIKDNTDFLLQRSVCVIKPKRCVLPSYLKYYLDTSKTQAYMQSNAHGSAQAGLYLNQVAEIEIMLPTLKEQERIVSILDRFDSLCNDISSGLPAEIEARQKQYEYYRDKLLSF